MGLVRESVRVEIELEKLVDAVSVSTTFVLLTIVVTSSRDVAELRTVEVAAAPLLVFVSIEVTTTNDGVVKIEVVRRIEVRVAETVTGTGTENVIGSCEAVTEVDVARSASQTPAFVMKEPHCPWTNFFAFARSPALHVFAIQQLVPD